MPLVVESCVRFINLNGKQDLGPPAAHLAPDPRGGGEGTWHPSALILPPGLQHEGIFRVSGAQPRVSEIRDAFERGRDRQEGVGVGGEPELL